MISTTYNAAMMDAETGGNANYAFEASMNLMDMPPNEIMDAFIKHLDNEGTYPSPMSCQLDSAIVKKDKGVLLATGSLILSRGEIPFLVMISPQNRQ
jgi:hypothetical protein